MGQGLRQNGFLQADPQALVTGRLSAGYDYRGFADAAQPGEKGGQVRVGPAVHRRGGDPDLEAVAMHTTDCILAGSGLDVDVEEQVVTLPGIPSGHQ